MDSNQIQKQQLQAKKYIEDHDLEKIVCEMLNSVVHEKSKQPVIYMIKYLAGLLTEEERKSHNFIIPEPYPKGKPFVQYPILDGNSESYLKKNLNQSNWNKIKYNKTKYGGGIMTMIKQSENDKNAKVGIILTDSHAIETFAPLVVPIINDIHGINSIFDFNFETREFISEKKLNNVEKYFMEYSRNLQNLPFLAIMNKEQRIHVENQIKNVILSSFQGKYLTFKEDEEEIRKIFDKNYLYYDAMDQFLTKSELKKDWPENRALFYSQNQDFIIIINYLDHLKIISIHNEFSTCYNNLLNLSNIFEKTLKYEIHRNYGYVNSCPSILGHALKISILFKLDNLLKITEHKTLIDKLNFNNSIYSTNSVFLVERNKLKHLTEESFLNYILEKVSQLNYFENNIKSMSTKLSIQGFNKEIVDSYEQNFESLKFSYNNQGEYFNSLFEKENSHQTFGLVVRSSGCYLSFKNFFDSFFLKFNAGYDSSKTQTYNTSFESYVLEIKDKSKLLQTNIKVNRNLEGLKFTNKFNFAENEEKILKYVSQCFKGAYSKFSSEEATKLLEKFNISFFNEESGFSLKDHSGIFLIEDKPIILLINDIDHLQFEINLQNIDDFKRFIHDLFVEINKFESNFKYALNSAYGFLSAIPLLCGTGFSIKSTLKLNNIEAFKTKISDLELKYNIFHRITNSDENIVEVTVYNKISKTEKEIFEIWNKVLKEIMESDDTEQ